MLLQIFLILKKSNNNILNNTKYVIFIYSLILELNSYKNIKYKIKIQINSKF